MTTLKPLLHPDVACGQAPSAGRGRANRPGPACRLALRHLTQLTVRDNALTTLLGLEALAGLTDLDVSRNALASLDELRRCAPGVFIYLFIYLLRTKK